MDVKHHVYFITGSKFQAVVNDTLPPTTAIIDYATSIVKLSANGQFFVGAQMAVSL